MKHEFGNIYVEFITDGLWHVREMSNMQIGTFERDDFGYWLFKPCGRTIDKTTLAFIVEFLSRLIVVDDMKRFETLESKPCKSTGKMPSESPTLS